MDISNNTSIKIHKERLGSAMTSREMDKYLKRLQLYIDKVKSEETPQEAINALIRTGVLSRSGKTIAKRHRLTVSEKRNLSSAGRHIAAG